MQSPLEPRVLNEASHEIRRQYLSAERARTILGWQPIFTLAEGLARTIPWYRELLA
jgi:CDP-glucose 4,6-dehydratase